LGLRKCGRAHGGRMEMMSEFQTHIPHPLRQDLPELLSRRSIINVSKKRSESLTILDYPAILEL
jgi:hypothetical protein